MSVRNVRRSRSSSLLGIRKNIFYVTAHPFTDVIQDYEIISTIGIIEDISHGYLAKHVSSGRFVSLKLTDLQMSSDFDLLKEMADITRNTRLFSHENILSYYTSFVDQERLWTVLEPIRLGSVKQIMIENFPLGFNNEALIATILRDVLRAVQYLHNNNCIHNNIRADNIYLDANGDVKLGGLHQLIEKVSGGVLRGAVFKFVGDPEWMAPEVLSQGWPALKILLCKLHYEVPAVEGSPKLPSKAFGKFLEKCLHKYPSFRPKASELMEDSFVKCARNSHYIENHLVRRMVTSPSTASEHELQLSPSGILLRDESNQIIEEQ